MMRLRATYRLRGAASLAAERAEALALEQTVELPLGALPSGFPAEEVIGQVESVRPNEDGTSLAVIAYPVATTGAEPSQLLNVLFGNSSLEGDVELVDVALPPDLAQALGGPRHGLEGIRKRLGASERPLTCTALKPMGLDAGDLGELCLRFARSGIDVIKDDHGLADQPFCSFEERIRSCRAAVERAAQQTGHHAVYAPNLSGAPSRVFEKLEDARGLGIEAFLVSPMLVGLPVFWEIASRAGDAFLLAHPALGGAARIHPPALLGTLFRAVGADAVIFPHAGGRFSYGPEVCHAIADRLREPQEGTRPALPVPAGGIRLENVERIVEFYGADVMLLVGGSLYEAGEGLEERTRAFVEAVRGRNDA